MYVQEYGSENPVLMVFIHGGGVSGWMWDKQVEFFRLKYHCLVLDLPEHGQSRAGSTFTINSAAAEINRLIEEKGEGKQVVAVGFSLGAQVLISMLSLNPTLIDFAMINSALAKPIPFANVLLKSMTLALPLVKIKAFSNIQAKSMYINAAYHETYYQESSQLSKDSFLRIMQENMAFSIPPGFADARASILVTVGEKERKVMRDSLNAIVASNPNCKALILPGIGHGFSLADPDLFNKTVETWLASI
ncbi:alpha/beta hydrolase [Sutcliffiella horikoshii]|uniref:alpha/beta fold hydrolase n=1 Tax=Sutcliffiella horikoshii TaxID=79883 RepID=UPI00203C7AC8|nr:alpha/beta hydrolase [Sutcliffiella horikoshii]MCM3618372.1 alpha/beta hydrolase [Sutcliffiella horikoshii]